MEHERLDRLKHERLDQRKHYNRQRGLHRGFGLGQRLQRQCHRDEQRHDLALELDGELRPRRSITSFWSAKGGTKVGNRYTFTNESWNGTIAPGKSVTFGVQTSSSATRWRRTSPSIGDTASTDTGSTGSTGTARIPRVVPGQLPEHRHDRGGSTTIPATRAVVGYWHNWETPASPYIPCAMSTVATAR